jgi:hypothetical protein
VIAAPNRTGSESQRALEADASTMNHRLIHLPVVSDPLSNYGSDSDLSRPLRWRSGLHVDPLTVKHACGKKPELRLVHCDHHAGPHLTRQSEST